MHYSRLRLLSETDFNAHRRTAVAVLATASLLAKAAPDVNESDMFSLTSPVKL
ncbi:hypothetical protein GCM10027361_05380 [Erwinia aphidicola]